MSGSAALPSGCLLRGRLGLLTWFLAAATFSSLLAFLQPSVMDAWAAFDFIGSIAGGPAGVTAETQYLSFAGEIVTPVIAFPMALQARSSPSS